MKIYISGKIAGDPDYKGKFARAAAQLERLGATVINPATAPKGLTKLDYMRICFAEMEAVDYVVFLPDWSSSDGAKLERAWCDYVGVPAASWDSFLKSMQGIKNAACGYSFRDLLALEHPNAVDETCIGGCFGCPNTYGYEPKNKPCPHEHVHQREVKEVLCAACWDRIVPGSEALHNE